MLTTIRRQLLPAIGLLVVMVVICCIAYPAATWAVGQVAFNHQANGSLLKDNGKVVGSALIGQNFVDGQGNPLPQYFQPRPSEAGSSGYDPTSSSASNLGPSDPRLVGYIGGFNTPDGANGKPTVTDPWATPTDPYCVPTDATTGDPADPPSTRQKLARNSDGTYICDANTIPERAITYRQLNGLAANATVPIDAVTASGSGLDPDISVANADLQAPRVAKVRNLSLATVMAAVAAHTEGPQLGALSEKGVNVVELNLALEKIGS
jgi:K+-transporting ATPase ATPase C chain